MLKKKVGEGSSRSIDGHGRAHSTFTQGASDIPDTLSVEYLLSDDSPRVPFSSSSKSFTHDGGIRITSVTDRKASHNKGFTSVRSYVGPARHDRGGVTKRGVVREMCSDSKKLLKFVCKRKDDVMNKFDPITFNRRDSKPVNGLERKDDVMKKFDPITFNRTDSKPVNGLERKDAVMKKFHPITFNQRDSKPISGLERKDDVVKKFHPITHNSRDSKPINVLERKVEVTRKFDPTTINRRDPKAVNGSPKRKSEAISIRDLVSEKKPRMTLRIPIKKEVSHIPKMGYNAPKTEYKVPKTEYKKPKVEDKYKVPNFKEFSFLKSTPQGIPKQSTDTSGPACSITSTVSNGNSVGSQFSALKTAINSVVASQVSTLKTPISLIRASQVSMLKTPINSFGALQVSTLKTPIDSVGPSQISTLNTPINQMGVGCSRIRPKYERVKLEDTVEDLSQPKMEATLPDGLLAVPLMKHQRIALSWMVNQETTSTSCCGGILADDQGLGKTISTIALILKERSPSSKSPKSNNSQQSDVDMLNSDEDRLPAGTLIVCPTSVLRQWSQELVNKVTPEADLSVLVYHGSNRTKDPVELAKYDVVVTTYALVGQEVPEEPAVNEDDDPHGNPFHRWKKKKQPDSRKKKNKESGPLGKVGWFRVVLDEAQCTKNHRTMTARACWGLHAKRRWCLSGTPIQNTIEDLYSYFRFLKHDPYAVFKTFCEQIKSVITFNPMDGYKRLQAVLKTLLLRRTKSTFIDGEPIIVLPPKTIELLQIEFAKEERAFYIKLEAESRNQFKEYAAAGTVKQNYAVILVLLLRLRQACGHPCLVNMLNYNSQKTSSVEMAKKLPREKQMSLLNCLVASSSICGICNDSPEDAVVTVCGHVYCHQCICELMIGEDTECPADNCKTNLVMARVFSKDVLQAAISDQESVVNNPNEGVSDSRSSTWPQTSSKIKATLKLLLSISKPQRKNETSSETSGFVGGKTIVFSQWTKMLDLLENSLKEYSIEYRRLDGTMPVTARDKSVKDFNTLPQVTVVIMSLKAACLGLNMVAANNVILMDLWWNPTTEDQAIDRAHRIGQTRPVSVYRITVKDTVEDRILELQREKRNIVASAFGEEGTGGQQTGLSVEELSYLFKA